MGKTRRKRGDKRTKRGGKILGEGAFAAVVDPAIPCKDGRDMSSYVSRVSKRMRIQDIISKDKPEVIKRLKEIDPSQKYFYYSEYCEPGRMLKENKIDGVNSMNKKFYEIIRRGKEVWNPYMVHKPRSWKGFFNGKSLGKKHPFPSRTTEQIDYLEKAIDLLHKNGIVHGDLHGHNVIMGEDNMPRIIDFQFTVLEAPDLAVEMEKWSVEMMWPSLDPGWDRSR